MKYSALLLACSITICVPALALAQAQPQSTSSGGLSYGSPSGRSQTTTPSQPGGSVPITPPGQASGTRTTTNPFGNEYGTPVPGVTTTR